MDKDLDNNDLPVVRSAFRGLSYDRKFKGWRVRISFAGKQRHVGRYATEIEAARAYDKAAVYLYGSRAVTNFGVEACQRDPAAVSGFVVTANNLVQAQVTANRQRSNPSCTASQQYNPLGCTARQQYHSSSSLAAPTPQQWVTQRVSLDQQLMSNQLSQLTVAMTASQQALQQQQQQQYMLQLPQQQSYSLELQELLQFQQHQQQQQQQQLLLLLAAAMSSPAAIPTLQPACQMLLPGQEQQQQELLSAVCSLAAMPTLPLGCQQQQQQLAGLEQLQVPLLEKGLSPALYRVPCPCSSPCSVLLLHQTLVLPQLQQPSGRTLAAAAAA